MRPFSKYRRKLVKRLFAIEIPEPPKKVKRIRPKLTQQMIDRKREEILARRAA